jgi:hypothetical protein
MLLNILPLPLTILAYFQKASNMPLMMLVLLMTSLTMTYAASDEATLMYSWTSVEYDWPNATAKQQYIDDNMYVVENNLIAGLKV